MADFRYFGRFNPRSNGPDSSDGSGEVDEAEARRRYFDRSARLDIVPQADPKTGKVPYTILVATGERPGFVVQSYDDAGLPILEEKWVAQPDGRLFLIQVLVRRYDLRPWTSMRKRNSAGWDSQVTLNIDPDGHAYIQALERENGRALPGEVTAETQIDPALLFRDPPSWGGWEALLDSPLGSDGFDLFGAPAGE